MIRSASERVKQADHDRIDVAALCGMNHRAKGIAGRVEVEVKLLKYSLPATQMHAFLSALFLHILHQLLKFHKTTS